MLGSRAYSLRGDGLAHYGMLADFLEAIRRQPQGAAPYKALFQSAEDVIKMWEKAVAAARNVPSPGSSLGGLRPPNGS